MSRTVERRIHTNLNNIDILIYNKYLRGFSETSSAVNIITEGKLKAGAAFIKLARQYGAKLVRSKKHNVFRDAAGHQITAPKTTSDFRAIKNFESELKGRGFIKQDTVSKVKDALVKGSKETVLKPATKTSANAGTVNRQTTFKDFTQKYQPNVQGPKRSELQVQADHILKTERKRRKMITKAQLDSMKISQKEKDELIRKGLVNMSEDNKHRDAKLNYQYKQVTDPKRPVDPIKLLKLKKGTV